MAAGVLDGFASDAGRVEMEMVDPTELVPCGSKGLSISKTGLQLSLVPHTVSRISHAAPRQGERRGRRTDEEVVLCGGHVRDDDVHLRLYVREVRRERLANWKCPGREPRKVHEHEGRCLHQINCAVSVRCPR